MTRQHTTYLSLGSNQGDRLGHLQNAIENIATKIGPITRVSSVYKTEAWGFTGDYFLNACIEVQTHMAPEKIMPDLLAIEQELGRERSSSEGYRSRSIDIDILLFDQVQMSSSHLAIPHPRMLERSFVLTPLNEIAGEVYHPVAEQNISTCLERCADTTTIKKTGLSLRATDHSLSRFGYIAIEGNIGSGKTTLAHMISEQYNAKLVLERFADNPFLPKFYQDKERFAFPLEMSFLADRYSQLTDDLAQFDLFKNFIISDYYIFKSLIFANITLAADEYQLYRRVFDIMYKEITKPELYVFLYQSTERLLENIKKRGREYEQNIDASYLEKIHQGYANFIKTEQHLNTLVIDVSELDFVNNPKDYKQIIEKIQQFKTQ